MLTDLVEGSKDAKVGGALKVPLALHGAVVLADGSVQLDAGPLAFGKLSLTQVPRNHSTVSLKRKSEREREKERQRKRYIDT